MKQALQREKEEDEYKNEEGTIILDEIRATLVDHVFNHALSTREKFEIT